MEQLRPDLYEILSSFLDHVKELGWKVYTCTDFNILSCVAYYMIEVPNTEKACIYYRVWQKTINPATVERDFFIMREMLYADICDYLILIYSPGHNEPFSFLFHERPKDLDKLVIFDVDTQYSRYSISFYSDGITSFVADEFRKHLSSIGYKRW